MCVGGCGMFVETITQPREAPDALGPPSALAASIAWYAGDGMVTPVNVWDAPGAVSDFSMERVLPLVEVEGEPVHKPQRHGEPVAVYLRPSFHARTAYVPLCEGQMTASTTEWNASSMWIAGSGVSCRRSADS